MAVRRVIPLAILTVLAVAACGQAVGSGTGGPARDTDAAKVIPFAVFLEGLQSASYAGYAGRPGTRVRSRQAFAQMRTFLLARYKDVRVVRSYASEGAVFDCTRQTGPWHTPRRPRPVATHRKQLAEPASGRGAPEGGGVMISGAYEGMSWSAAMSWRAEASSERGTSTRTPPPSCSGEYCPPASSADTTALTPLLRSMPTISSASMRLAASATGTLAISPAAS